MYTDKDEFMKGISMAKKNDKRISEISGIFKMVSWSQLVSVNAKHKQCGYKPVIS
jgi:hypothetical protein